MRGVPAYNLYRLAAGGEEKKEITGDTPDPGRATAPLHP